MRLIDASSANLLWPSASTPGKKISIDEWTMRVCRLKGPQKDYERVVLVLVLQCPGVDMTLDAPKISC